MARRVDHVGATGGQRAQLFRGNGRDRRRDGLESLQQLRARFGSQPPVSRTRSTQQVTGPSFGRATKPPSPRCCDTRAASESCSGTTRTLVMRVLHRVVYAQRITFG